MKYFFIGIGGIGMSALAKIMHNKGYEVYGSNIEKNENTEMLETLNIKISYRHKEENVHGMDYVVYSSAISSTNPEYLYSMQNNIPIIRRGELLAKVSKDQNLIAIAGTHGKTTTTTIMSQLINELDPTVCVGGIVKNWKSNLRWGAGNYFLTEADESDNSFLYLEPSYSVITNIEEDHMENHGNKQNLEKSFLKFIENTSKKVIISKDCKALQKIAKNKTNIVTYSIKGKADIYAENIRLFDKYSMFDVVFKESKIKVNDFKINIPGKHNVSNSLPCIYLANHLGVKLENIKNAFSEIRSPERRFDIIYDDVITVVDDYAHHPTEIVATLESAKLQKKKRIVCVFQPHRYSRTKTLLRYFKDAFNESDRIILLPIYAAGEVNIYNTSEEDIFNIISCKDKAEIIKTEKDLIDDLVENSSEGDLLLFLGAGDVHNIAYSFRESFVRHCNQKNCLVASL